MLLLSLSTARADDAHPKPCSNRSLQGTFGFYRTGHMYFGTGGLAAVGWLSFDGKGNASVLQSVSRNGEYSFDEEGPFLYAVEANCTGKLLDTDGNEFSRIVVTQDGSALYMMSETDGNSVYGVGTKIHAD